MKLQTTVQQGNTHPSEEHNLGCHLCFPEENALGLGRAPFS